MRLAGAGRRPALRRASRPCVEHAGRIDLRRGRRPTAAANVQPAADCRRPSARSRSAPSRACVCQTGCRSASSSSTRSRLSRSPTQAVGAVPHDDRGRSAGPPSDRLPTRDRRTRPCAWSICFGEVAVGLAVDGQLGGAVVGRAALRGRCPWGRRSPPRGTPAPRPATESAACPATRCARSGRPAAPTPAAAARAGQRGQGQPRSRPSGSVAPGSVQPHGRQAEAGSTGRSTRVGVLAPALRTTACPCRPRSSLRRPWSSTLAGLQRLPGHVARERLLPASLQRRQQLRRRGRQRLLERGDLLLELRPAAASARSV